MQVEAAAVAQTGIFFFEGAKTAERPGTMTSVYDEGTFNTSCIHNHIYQRWHS